MSDLPDTNHFTRYCPRTQIYEDGSIDPSAFSLRIMNNSKAEEYGSVNWVEYHDTDLETAISEIRAILKKKISRYRDDSILAYLNVGEVIKNVRKYSLDERVIEIKHHKTKGNKSHSGIFNLRVDDDLVSELIAEKVLTIYE